MIFWPEKTLLKLYSKVHFLRQFMTDKEDKYLWTSSLDSELVPEDDAASWVIYRNMNI